MFCSDGVTKNMRVVHKGCIGQSKGGREQCKRVYQRSLEVCLERGKAQREECSSEVAGSRGQ